MAHNQGKFIMTFAESPDMRILYSPEEIDERLNTLAMEIMSALGDNFVMVPILTGGFMFAADLSRALYRIGADPEIDFIQLSSYGTGRVSSGEVQLMKDVTAPVEGLPVLLVDDVLDSGKSIKFAHELFSQRGASQIKTCVAVDKMHGRAREAVANFKLFELTEDKFLVGYGMDDAGARRGLPSINVLND